MSAQEINDLKRSVKRYRDADNQIRDLNKELYAKREDRKIAEMEISDIIKRPPFESVDRLKFDDDTSSIKIARPGEYNKPWSLSKKELEILLKAYFTEDRPLDANSCFQFIVEERQKALVGKEFDFTRVIPGE
jgi:hypothetical protein